MRSELFYQLHMASVRGRRRAAARDESKSIEALLRHGASLNIPDRIRQGPLWQSIKAHDASCTKLLLAYGTNVDQIENWKQAPLQSALYCTDFCSLLHKSLRFNNNEALKIIPKTDF